MGTGPRDWTPPEPRWGVRIEEGAARPWAAPSPGPGSPFDEFARARRRRTLTLIWSATGVLIVALIVTVGARFLPFAARESLAEVNPVAAFLVGVPQSTSDIAALARQSFLTDKGREVFYATSPRLLGDEVATTCSSPDGSEGDGIVAVGCYAGWEGAGRIYVFQPGDERLAGSMVTTAAHELLHAIYDRMDPAGQARIDELVAVEAVRIAPDDPTLQQIEWSVGGDERNRGTELFAYLGSQVMFDGGFAPELESIYAEWFTDRSALVGVYRTSLAQLDEFVAQVEAAMQMLASHEQAAADARAQYDADKAWQEQAVAYYNEDAAQFNAIPPDQREGWTQTFTTFTGEEKTLPFGEALAYRLDELDRVKQDLEARAPLVEQQAADAAAERVQVEGLSNDIRNLLDAAYPGQG